LPALPSTLNDLYCQNNHLNTLPFLPTPLAILYCYGNNLTILPALPVFLKYLECGSNAITNLPVLPQGLLVLECDNDQLDSLPNLPSSITELLCVGNYLSSLPALPLNLQQLNCSYNQLGTLPALPSSLTYLECTHNRLTEIPSLPDSLSYFNCFSNPPLTCLPKLKTIAYLEFDSTSVKCIPDYGNVSLSSPALNSLPLCDSINPDGCPFYTSVPDIRELTFSVYPNPAFNFVLVTLEDKQEAVALQIVDISGKEVIAVSCSNDSFELPVHQLQDGLYFVKAIDKSGLTGVRKLVIQR
jgi:Leucine-rich repeat (LRR) protein